MNGLPDNFRTITVIGAGTMGHGIAHVSALAGFETRLFDVDEAGLGRGMGQVEANLSKGVARGKVTEQDAQEALSRLHGTSDMGSA